MSEQKTESDRYLKLGLLSLDTENLQLKDGTEEILDFWEENFSLNLSIEIFFFFFFSIKF